MRHYTATDHVDSVSSDLSAFSNMFFLLWEMNNGIFIMSNDNVLYNSKLISVSRFRLMDILKRRSEHLWTGEFNVL
jgi:hypothetical protein